MATVYTVIYSIYVYWATIEHLFEYPTATQGLESVLGGKNKKATDVLIFWVYLLGKHAPFKCTYITTTYPSTRG